VSREPQEQVRARQGRLPGKTVAMAAGIVQSQCWLVCKAMHSREPAQASGAEQTDSRLLR
jgi:hypothetical protein